MLDDLDNIRLVDNISATDNTTYPAGIEGGWFILGPIPGPWIGKVAHLSGNHTVHVGLAIQYVRGLQKKGSIILDRFILDRFGVKKDSARRALNLLQEAGLIKFTREGQKFKVTILHPENI